MAFGLLLGTLSNCFTSGLMEFIMKMPAVLFFSCAICLAGNRMGVAFSDAPFSCEITFGSPIVLSALWTQAQYELLWESLRERVIAKQIDPSEMNKIPKTPLVFRCPYGACSPLALDKLKQYGLPAIQWSIVTGDPAKGRSAREIAQVIDCRLDVG